MIHTLLFISIYALGFVLTIVSNPAYSFVLYEVVYFFSPLDRWWGNNLPAISYSFFTVMLMFFALFLKGSESRSQNKLLAPPQFKWFYLLIFLYGITWFYAVNPDGHLTAAINFLKLGIIMSVAYKLIDTVRNLDYSLWGYIFGSWYISFLTYQTGRNSYGGRVEGVGTVDSPDANGIAAAIAPSLVICLYYFWITKSITQKLIIAFAGVFIANALILINSRGAFLGAGVSLLFFMFHMYFSSIQRKYQKAIAVGITIAGLSGVFYLADETTFERIKTMQNVEITEEEQTGTTRFLFWLYAWEMAKDYPLGSGYRGFDYRAPAYIPEGVDTGYSRNRAVHSTWFEALTDIGYIGLILLILMVYSTYKTIQLCKIRLKEDGDFENYFKIIALQAALISFLISFSFINRLRSEMLYWLILYIACAYNIYVIKSSEADKALNVSNRKKYTLQ